MENNNAIFVKLSIAIISICAVILTIVTLIPDNEYNAGDIYKRNISSILELKCEAVGIGESYGTAEVITNERILVTNAHVVSYKKLDNTQLFENCSVRSAIEKEYTEVEVIKYDFEKDLAILDFVSPNSSLKYDSITVGNSNDLEHGSKVYAMGNGQNFGISIAEGIVGIPLINLQYDNLSKSVIQSDLNITEGNSGGALLDKSGKIVGITSFRVKDSSGNVVYGICYSIPINDVLLFINE